MSPNRIKIRLALLSLLLLAQFPTSFSQAQDRPRVGVALSGGGAKGFAHVGVLRVLEEVGLPVDYITGTSMGSIIGGLYAIGYSVDELEAIAVTTDWRDLFSDRVSRRQLAIESKLADGRYLLTLPLDGIKPGLPTGLIAGQKISTLFERLTLPYHHVSDFRNFPIPFACVATNIATGNVVVLDHGYLPEAMRASMAIPSVFTPMEIDDRLLVDGMLVRNFPVEEVKAMGADIIVGVDVGSGLSGKEELTSLAAILGQAMGFTDAESTQRQRELCDVLIVPDIEGLSAVDFQKAEEIIARGETAARAALLQLQTLADSLQSVRRPQAGFVQINLDSVVIRDIQVEGLQKVTPKLLYGNLNLKAPMRTSIAEIERAVKRLYNTQFFERVTYRLDHGAKGATLLVQVREKRRTFFRTGLTYNSADELMAIFNTVFRNIAGRSSQTNFDFIVGERIQVTARHFIHPGLRARVGLAARFNYSDDFVDVRLTDGSGTRLNIKSGSAELLLGSAFSNKLGMGIGLRAEYTNIDRDLGLISFESSTEEFAALMGEFWFDQLDRTYFPRSGVALHSRHELADRNFGSDATFRRHYADLKLVLPLHRKLSLQTEVVLGSTDGDGLPAHYMFILGGIDTPVLLLERERTRVSFAGLKSQELFGEHVQSFHIGLQYEFANNAYLVARANAGNTFDDWEWDFFESDRYKTGVGLTLGLDTPFGPFELTAMHGSGDNFNTHLNVGMKF